DLCDAGLHLFDTGAGARRRDRHHRQIDVGKEIHAHAEIGDDAADHRHENQHAGEDGAFDEEIRDLHSFAPAVCCGWSRGATETPVASLLAPSTTIDSLPSSPLVTSTSSP